MLVKLESFKDKQPQSPLLLDHDVLLHIVSFLSSPADAHALFCTSKAALAIASDPIALAKWLLRHQGHEHALNHVWNVGRGLLRGRPGQPAGGKD